MIPRRAPPPELEDVADVAAVPAPWFVLVTETQRESTAAAGLIGRRIPAYCPQEPKSIRQNYHKRRTVMRPMLVGYIFARWNGSPWQWVRIHGVSGVRRLLKVNDQAAPVPEAALTYLREREAEAMAQFGKPKRSVPQCEVGDWVQVIDHFALTGLFGQVVGLLDAKGRIQLHVDLFGRQTPLEVSAKQVRVL